MAATVVKPCPCINSGSILLCSRKSSIQKLPEDIINNCQINPLNFTTINIKNQDIVHLEANVFTNFPNLRQLELRSNNIRHIHKGAFAKLGRLKVLQLNGNNISIVEDGALDDLHQIDFIDFTGNPELKSVHYSKTFLCKCIDFKEYCFSYNSNLWSFCHNVNFGEATIDGKINLFEDIQDISNEITEDYCGKWMADHGDYQDQHCTKKLVNNVSDVYDCSKATDVQGLSCALESMFNGSTSHVLIPLKLREDQQEAYEYYKNDDIFQSFENFKRDDLKFNKLKKHLVIYDAIFDVSTLPMHTTEGITENVIIRADTVYMTKLLQISYNLTIISRVASLSYPIIMKIDEMHSKILKMKPFRRVLINYSNSALTMRHLSFGLVDLFDKPRKSIKSKCLPSNKEAINHSNPSWYDRAYIDLVYVYARSLVARNQTETALAIANTIIHLYDNSKVVSNNQAFIAAKKFKNIRDLANKKKNIGEIHQVPRYSMEVLEKLSAIMYTKLKASSDVVAKEEINLQNLKNRLVDLSVHFDVLESGHELYFKAEKKVMEQLNQATNLENQNTIFQSQLR